MVDEGQDSVHSITVTYKDREVDVPIRENFPAEETRQALYDAFEDLVDHVGLVKGIYKFCFGPSWPCDVVAAHAHSFAKDTGSKFFLYVITPYNLEHGDVDKPYHATELILPSTAFSQAEAQLHCRTFVTLLRQYGYVRFTLPPQKGKIVEQAMAEIKQFFAMSADKKKQCHADPFGGWSVKANKETFYVHQSHINKKHKQIWPSRKAFRKAITNYWELLHGTAIELLEAIAIALGCQKDVFRPILDNHPVPWRVATAMQIFQYNPFDHDDHLETVQCREHPDTSLLTLAPCSTQPELLMVQRHTGEWCSVEDGANPHDMIVFPGTYLARISAGYFVAPLHRVVHQGTGSRISTPFFLRASPNAPLNPSLLQPADNAASLKEVTPKGNTARAVDRTVMQFLSEDVHALPRLN